MSALPIGFFISRERRSFLWDNHRQTLSKAIADLSVETLSSQQIELLSGYLDDWEHISFEDKRKAADGLISSISATSDYVKMEWKK